MPAEATRQLSYAQAIREALHESMARDRRVLVIGEGVPDPKGIFGTTAGLRSAFGAQRVCDMPLSENGMTGVCIGAALSGLRPVLVHQRIDFALLAMDQLVNNAAKWSYMFDGQGRVPLVVRAIIGRGWGQGPQHSQSLQALFAHIPGLKVVMPVTAHDAKGMLIAAIEDDDPVMFLEHRWLHATTGHVPEGYYRAPLHGARVMREGNDVTVAAFSYMVLEALQAANALADQGIQVEVIDMRSVSPLDVDTVLTSLRKTGRLLVTDTGHKSFGVAAELVSRVMEEGFDLLERAPLRVATPDHPAPTSHFAANDYYPEAPELARAILQLADAARGAATERAVAALRRTTPRDVPNPNFSGPF